MSKSYTADNIWSYDGLESVRKLPTQYIHDTDIAGIAHIYREIIDNAFDEVKELQDHHNRRETIDVFFFNDKKRKTCQIMIVDTGRGVPVEKLFDSYNRLHTSGKYDQTVYGDSGGLFGVGAKVCNALSTRFKALCINEVKNDTGKCGYFYSEKGVIKLDKIECREKIKRVRSDHKTGTIVIGEPDNTIFTNVPRFYEEGYLDLLTTIQKMVTFKDLSIRVWRFNQPIDSAVWTMDANATLEYKEQLLSTRKALSYTSKHKDTTKFLTNYWEIRKPLAYHYEYSRDILVKGEHNSFGIKLHLLGYTGITSRKLLGFINTIEVSVPKALHFDLTTHILKKLLAGNIEAKPVREFFMSDAYNLPIQIALLCNIPGAKFTGAQKYDFNFKKEEGGVGGEKEQALARAALQKQITQVLKSDPAALETIWKTHSESVYDAYNRANNIVTAKGSKRLFQKLNFAGRYSECEKLGPNAELIIVEGESAKTNVGRDSKNQAVLALSGKTLNALTTIDRLDESQKKIIKNKIYKDLIAILNVNMRSKDLSSMNFGKILICTDADTHGYHIRQLILGALFAINKEIISSGMVHIIIPPLFTIFLNKSKKNHVHIVDLKTYEEFFIAMVFKNSFDIHVRHLADKSNKPTKLNANEYVDFCKKIFQVGEIISSIADTLNVDPLILEGLAGVAHYLTPETMDVNVLKRAFNSDCIEYDPEHNFLIITYGDQDITITLHGVQKSIYTYILPCLRELHPSKLVYSITSTLNDSYRDHVLSVMQLYIMFHKVCSYYKPKRHKGLASLDKMAREVIFEETRYVKQINSIGDVQRIFDMLGDDATERKRLLLDEDYAF